MGKGMEKKQGGGYVRHDAGCPVFAVAYAKWTCYIYVSAQFQNGPFSSVYRSVTSATQVLRDDDGLERKLWSLKYLGCRLTGYYRTSSCSQKKDQLACILHNFALSLNHSSKE